MLVRAHNNLSWRHLNAYPCPYARQVTEAGGMTKFIDSGAAKLRIEEAATKKQVRVPRYVGRASRGQRWFIAHRGAELHAGST